MSSETPEVKKTETVAPDGNKTMNYVALLLGVTTFALFISTTLLAVDRSNNRNSKSSTAAAAPPAIAAEIFSTTKSSLTGVNVCDGQKVDLNSTQCVINQVVKAGDQSGTNVTKGYQGLLNTTAVPITVPFYEAGLCPVNVHWHLGTEHLSVGEYDETGTCVVVSPSPRA
jgi:hypothetical protein